MLDVLIKNANIIDGTGKPAYKGSIGISGGKLVMADGSEEATAVIDASGKYVSPGWIDAHSHGDLILGSEDAHLFKTTQGVTTELTGQCGLSMAPVMPENLAAVQNMLSMGTTWFPDDMKNWSSFARFLEYADQQKLTANAKMYIGHSSLRIAVMGMANRPATDAELDRMKGILREAMEDGAAGFSTGLIYTPSCYAEEKEIIELAKVIAPDGRIHTSFQNTVTATGRLSSTEPNLQNIPVRTELGAQIRTMFIARPGWVLVDADYSQIELRLLAHMAGDEKMIAAFQSGQDIHAQTASQVFGLPPEEVTGELRRRAKAVNFGIVYGISDFSLAQDIGVSRQEAADYMNKYLATFSGVREYMEHVKTQAKEDGYVATLMGRRRWLPELKSTNYNLRAFGERVALNMPIQGTAADLIKKAMLHVDSRLRREGLEARLVLQVHDELIVECPEGEAEQVQRLLAEEMEHVAELAVPLTAEAHAGKSWAEAKG